MKPFIDWRGNEFSFLRQFVYKFSFSRRLLDLLVTAVYILTRPRQKKLLDSRICRVLSPGSNNSPIRQMMAPELLFKYGVMNTNASNIQQQDNGRFARIICIGLLIQGLVGCSDADKPDLEAGATFPLPALEQLININEGGLDLEGKTLLINFWATWCAPCRKEMPELQRLSDRLNPAYFVVIGISVDEDINLVREFMLQYGIHFANLQDKNFLLASDLLGIKSFPETLIVSPNGVITRRISGILPLDQNKIEQDLEASEKYMQIHLTRE